MEKENKKFRDVGKKEYNDLVRSLVAFVRKRDPRVKAYNQKLEAKREENAKKTAENRKKQLAEQARLRSEVIYRNNAAKYILLLYLPTKTPTPPTKTMGNFTKHSSFLTRSYWEKFNCKMTEFCLLILRNLVDM